MAEITPGDAFPFEMKFKELLNSSPMLAVPCTHGLIEVDLTWKETAFTKTESVTEGH